MQEHYEDLVLKRITVRNKNVSNAVLIILGLLVCFGCIILLNVYVLKDSLTTAICGGVVIIIMTFLLDPLFESREKKK